MARAQSAPPGLAANAAADENGRGTILLVRTHDDERVVVRLRAELAAGDWRVLEVGPDPELERASLGPLATAHGARGAIRADPRRGRVELWVMAPPGSGPASNETLRVEGSPPDPTVLCMRATEALRARGLPIERPAPAAPVAPPAPRAPALRPASLPTPRAQAVLEQEPAEPLPEPSSAPRPVPTAGLWLELGPSVLYSPGGFGGELEGWLALRLQPERRFSLAAFGLVPLYTQYVQQAEGRTDLSPVLLGAGAAWHDRLRPIELDVGAGMGGVRWQMRGRNARPPLMNEPDSVLAALPFASVALHLDLGRGFRLCASGLFGMALPRVVVKFDEREVADWGRPFVVGTLGLEVPVLEWAWGL